MSQLATVPTSLDLRTQLHQMVVAGLLGSLLKSKHERWGEVQRQEILETGKTEKTEEPQA